MKIHEQNKQGRSLGAKTVLASFSLISLALIAVWWVGDVTDQSIEIGATESVAEQELILIENQSNTDTESEIIENSVLTDNQNIFDDIWLKIHDPDLRDTLTARQLLDTPGFNRLSADQMQRLVNEVMVLLKDKELDSSVFMSDISRKNNDGTLNNVLSENITEVSINQTKEAQKVEEATFEQAQAMDNVRQLLNDPEKVGDLTAAELLESDDVKSLPAHLRHELANEVVGMLSSGEIDSATFLAARPSKDLNSGLSDEEKRASITHEQWQSFDVIQTRLHDSQFNADTMLPELLTSKEYKTLPIYLRNQLSAEAVAMIESEKSN